MRLRKPGAARLRLPVRAVPGMVARLMSQEISDAASRCPLMLLPGLDGSGRLLEPLAAELSRVADCRVMRLPDPTGDYAALERWLVAELERTGPCVLLGESFSGPLVLRVARCRPDLVRALVLVATFSRRPRRVPAWVTPLAHALRRLPLRPGLGLIADSGLAPELRGSLEPAILGLPARTLVNRLRSVLRLRDEAEGAPAPATLVLAATRDRLVPPREQRRLATVVPGARLVEIPGPHLLAECRTRECAAAIAEFLAPLSQPPENVQLNT